MKKLLYSFIVLASLLLVLVDRQPASETKDKPAHRRHGDTPAGVPRGGKAAMAPPGKDWRVSLHLTDLGEATACDYEDLLVTKFNNEIVEGGGFVTIQKGDCNGIT